MTSFAFGQNDRKTVQESHVNCLFEPVASSQRYVKYNVGLTIIQERNQHFPGILNMTCPHNEQ